MYCNCYSTSRNNWTHHNWIYMDMYYTYEHCVTVCWPYSQLSSICIRHDYGGGSGNYSTMKYTSIVSHTPFEGSLLPRGVRGGGTLVSDPLALRFLEARGRGGLAVGGFSGLFF